MESMMEEIVENDTSETIVVDEAPMEEVQTEEVVTSHVIDSECIEVNTVSQQSILDASLETSKAPDRKIEKVVQLPLTRIKALMKLDPDVNLASQDAVLAVAKAAELFVYMLGKEAYKFTKQNKKKTIQKKDINDCIASCEALAFLEGTLKED